MEIQVETGKILLHSYKSINRKPICLMITRQMGLDFSYSFTFNEGTPLNRLHSSLYLVEKIFLENNKGRP
jgi:hypothetical protein